MDLRELAQNERFASLQAAAEADGVRRQQEAEAEEAMARFDQELAAAGTASLDTSTTCVHHCHFVSWQRG